MENTYYDKSQLKNEKYKFYRINSFKVKQIRQLNFILREAYNKCRQADDELNTEKLAEILYDKGYWYNVDVIDFTYNNVIKDIFNRIYDELNAALDSNYKAKGKHMENHENEVNDSFLHFVDGKITALSGIFDFICELEETFIFDANRQRKPE